MLGQLDHLPVGQFMGSLRVYSKMKVKMSNEIFSDFKFQLLLKGSDDGKKNFVFSPLSVFLGLTMVYEGLGRAFN